MTAPVVAAVVPAAGLGQRLGADGPKAMHLLGGEPMLVHSVRTLAAGPVDLVVVATPPGLGAEVLELLGGAHPGAELSVVDGGITRSDSVRLALAALPASVRVVLVHDAARPLVPGALVAAVVAAVEGGADAVVPGLPVTDTVKQVDDAGHVERAGGVVVVVPGAEEAFKVTRPLDLVLAEAVLAGRRQAGG